MIPFNKPTYVGEELRYIEQAICKDEKISGDGNFTKKCSSVIEGFLNTDATCLLTLGDEVICPSYTFSSTINSFILRGAVPVFVDIRIDTLNIDDKKIEEAITPRTKAISVVHYAGVSCEMDTISKIAKKYNLFIIEDSAQAIGSSYKGQYCGTFGELGAFSFHETKNVVCGEGGALIVNDKSFIDRAEIIREKGTNRKNFFSGKVDKYTWVDIGSSFLLSDMSAAYLYAQVQNIDIINNTRLSIWNQYYSKFEKYQKMEKVSLPFIPKDCVHNAHIFYMRFKNNNIRNNYIAHMKSKDILTPFHYIPLHNAPAGEKYGRVNGELKNTIQAAKTLVRLPLYYNMSQQDVIKVMNETIVFLDSI